MVGASNSWVGLHIALRLVSLGIEVESYRAFCEQEWDVGCGCQAKGRTLLKEIAHIVFALLLAYGNLLLPYGGLGLHVSACLGIADVVAMVVVLSVCFLESPV